ncbi:2030_t:CDS:2 [Gigaspora margarita]|uniref:Chitin synthase n=1 Tax=Gigaspora margarita TaxID=4874 RepID=A0ABN7TZ95_GIGMA|nr:2030_t:CDS:2 [Gigaspora margarita]
MEELEEKVKKTDCDEDSIIDHIKQRRNICKIHDVTLTNGNLVFDHPVPNCVLNKFLKEKNWDNKEFTKVRYIAITCDTDNFVKKKYTIRQKKNSTEIMIVITMYNENYTHFIKTMSSVIKNVEYICSKKSKTWRDEVSDGHNKINKRTLDVLSVMGCYQDGIVQDRVNNRRPVTAHLFEYTTQLMFDNDLNVQTSKIPVQVMFCLKQKNAKKINSHRWSFKAFAALLEPKFLALLASANFSITCAIALTFDIYSAFDHDNDVGGTCGKIKVDLGCKCRNLLNPLITAQNFEYKMSNILDKLSESVFALKNGPLEKYLKGEYDDLAATKTGSKHSAKAETDVPDNVPEFISQCRR